MSATKSRTGINSGTAMTAGAGDVNGTVVDLSGALGAQLDIKLTNGATGPTVAAQVQVQVAADYNGGSPTLWVNFGGPLTGLTGNNGVQHFSLQIPIGIAALRLVTGSNTGQNVTLDADVSLVTAV